MNARALLIAALLAMPMAASAAPITITAVSVTVGTSTFTASTVGWTLPVSLDPGQSLVLAQNDHVGQTESASYNFDLSDYGADLATVQVIVDGVVHTVPDLGGILTAHETVCCPNESHGYTEVYADDAFTLLFGYADNVHGGPDGCATPLCRPNPFESADVFQGTPGIVPVGASPFGCDIGQPCGWDTAVIQIVARPSGRSVDPVPEPATIGLLGLGLVVVAARVRLR